ncbi:MAG: exodeoxyribonuclease III [Solirubrobacteraceae bacterium]
MLIVSWNVASLRARLPRVLELLELHSPDIVCLQETKCGPANFPAAELDQAGYSVIHSSGGQWAGVAILIRGEVGEADPLVGLPGDPVASEARWVEATVHGLRVISVYVPNGRSLQSPEFPRKLAFLTAAAERTARWTQSPLVICGDFNVAPEDRDVHDPAAFLDSTHVSEPERAALARLEQRGGLIDAYRHLHAADQQFTWWDYRAGNFHKNLGMRIDLALTSAALAPALIECGIDRDFRKGHKPSDHAPLLLRLTVG